MSSSRMPRDQSMPARAKRSACARAATRAVWSSIADCWESMSAAADAAHEVVGAAKPDYLAVCGRHTLGHIGAAERDASLWGRLAAGDIPPWLERVEATRDAPFAVYRVKP